MELTLWACGLFVVYAYAGYPVLLYALSSVWGRSVHRSDGTPRVAFVIAARNEAARIREKIENTLAVRYPDALLEIVVASDCSDDGTDDIVREYADRGVRLIVSGERKGKEHAQALAIAATDSEILVFSDVATRLDNDGVAQIVANFGDPTVGCVSSVDVLAGEAGRGGGEGAYLRYEMWLRSLESKLGSVVGLSGSFFAARRVVCSPWPTDIPSDFNTLTNTLRHGMRGVSDPLAIGRYPDLADPAAEYRRKVRTVARGIAGLGRNIDVLNPLRHGVASWQLLSHKLCRWVVPFALAGLLAANMVLALGAGRYVLLGVAQVACYGVAAYAIYRRRSRGVVRWLAFFVLVNVSIFSAWVDVVRGRRYAIWQPSRR
jgi:hypothetical protein